MDTGAGSSGFNYLPNELIAEILVSLFNQYEAHHYDKLSELPWRFRQVCRKWRDVVNQTSALWTVLCLHYPVIDSLKRLGGRIQLSGLRELDVIVKLRRPPSSSKSATLDVSLEDLHFSRWRSIRLILLYLPNDGNIGVYDEIFTHPMPKLQTLSFDVRTLQPLDDHGHQCIELPRYPLPPSLRTLRLRDWSLNFGREYIGGLEHLEIDRVDHWGLFDEVIKFVQYSPQLRTLRLRFSIIQGEWYESTEEWYQEHLRSKTLHLPKLENLSITKICQWEGVLILSLIEAPLLTSLELDLLGHIAGPVELAWDYPEVSLIGFRSLRTLKLGPMEISHSIRTHVVTRLLSSADTVRQLILDGCSQERYLSYLTYPRSLPAILEQLQSPCFQGMLAGLEDFAVRNCPPVVLYDFYERNNLSSLTSFRVSAPEIDTIGRVPDHGYIWVEKHSRRVVDAVEKLRALSAFGIWRQEDCLSRRT